MGRAVCETLCPTNVHKLFSATRNDWVMTQNLRVGEALRTQSGLSRITGVRRKAGDQRVYNFEVEATHAYYVGQTRTLSHNMGCAVTNSGPVKPGATGTYGDLTVQKRAFGETESLHMDHQPSFAAQRKAAEQALGRPLTPKEIRALKKATPAVASPKAVHEQKSPTFGGRNTPARINEDAADPGSAQARDRAVFDEAMRCRK